MRMSVALLVTLLLSCSSEQPPPPKWQHLSSATDELPKPPARWKDQTACLVADFDRDGADDFMVTDRNAEPSVIWYRRSPDGWRQSVIDPEHVKIGAGGHAADIDGDGDLDASFGGRYDSSEIWWWENPAPDFARPWKRRALKRSGEGGHHDHIFGDFDADGTLELIAWNQRAKQLLYLEPPEAVRSDEEWQYSSIFVYEGDKNHEGLAAADINLDGKTDVIGGGYWFEHKGGAEFEAHQIDERMPFTRAAAGQFVKGGRPEVVFVPGDEAGPLRWYEWKDGRWQFHELLDTEVDHGHSIDTGDINLDGNLDLFVAEMGAWGREGVSNPDAKAWIFYGDGKGGFTTEVVSTGMANHESKLGDLNADGFLDIVSKPFRWETPRVDVWIQRGAAASGPLALDKWERHVIGEKDDRSLFVTTADLDGDNALDVMTGAWWYRQGNWDRRDIGAPLHNMVAVYDFDNDGDADILGTKGKGSEHSSEFVFASNDGGGNFTLTDAIEAAQGSFPQGVAVTRLSVGEPPSVLLSFHMPNGTSIQRLTTDAWKWQPLYDYAKPTKQLDAADIDRDGDTDILFVGNSGGGDLEWLRNDGDGKWSAHTWFSGAGNKSHRCLLADINRDGRIDGVVGHYREDPGYFAWYEQPVDPTQRWTEHVVAPAEVTVGPLSIAAADMDRDGDLDLIAGQHLLKETETAKLFLFENTDGNGAEWNTHVIHTGDEHHQGAHVTDIDRDGDLDILSIGWTHNRVLLYENRAVP